MLASVLENRMGIVFKDKALLMQALTHRSYINERKTQIEHNERLEFLGDAVLELIVSRYLYLTFPEDDEGVLTTKRMLVVNGEAAAKVAQALGVERFLLLSRGEGKDSQSKARTFILADAFEALLGALYLDQGYAVAEAFVHRVLLSEYKGKFNELELHSPKCKLQHVMQLEHQVTPRYEELHKTGKDHRLTFTVGVYLNERLIAEGTGGSKKDAEQQAAEKALAIL